MRTLVRQLLDNQIARRGLIKEMLALGISLSSAQALLASVSDAYAPAPDTFSTVRKFTGSGSDLLLESLMEADVKYIFHGNGGGSGLINSQLDVIS